MLKQKKTTQALSERTIPQETLAEIKHLLDHAANAVKENAYFPDNDRVMQFLNQIETLLEPFPAGLPIPGRVVDYFRRHYASVVSDLTKTEKEHMKDPADEPLRDFYIEASAQEQILSNICSELGIQLRDEDMNPIPFDTDWKNKSPVKYTEFPIDVIQLIRKEFQDAWKAMKDAEKISDEETAFFARCQKTYLEEIFCQEIDLVVSDNSGIPLYI